MQTRSMIKFCWASLLKACPTKACKNVHFSKPSSLDAAICLASEYESFDRPTEYKSPGKIHKPRDAVIAPIDQSSSKKPESSQTDKALTSMLNSMMNSLKDLGSKIEQIGSKPPTNTYQQPRSGFQGQCYSCHEQGHFARNCPKKSSRWTKDDSKEAPAKPSLN